MRKVNNNRIKDKQMDWTQIVLAVISGVVTVFGIVLPVTLNRSHKKTRALNSEESTAIYARVETLSETMTKMVGELATRLDKNIQTTQGLHLLDVIEHRPHYWEAIRREFAEYTAAGGNGHVARVYQQWEADYGQYYDAGKVPPLLIEIKPS